VVLIAGGTFAAVTVSHPRSTKPTPSAAPPAAATNVTAPPTAAPPPNPGPFTGTYTASLGPGTDLEGNPWPNVPPATRARSSEP